MKTTKRILACLMILAMLAAMLCGSASAAIKIQAGAENTTFTYYKVLNVETPSPTDSTAILYKWVSGYSTATGVDTTTNPGYVIVTNPVAFANAVLDDTTGLEKRTVVAGTTGNDEITFPDGNGYYVMKSSAATVPFAFTVFNGAILTPASGDDDAIESNLIKEKADLPTITKSVDDSKVGITDTVSYTITVTAEQNGKNYVVTDTLPAGVTPVSATANIDAANYTATIAGQLVTVTFENSYIGGLAAQTEIEITITGTVDSDIVVSEDPGKNINTATLAYGDGMSKTSNEVEIYSYKITLTKTGTKSDGITKVDHLAGAKFVLSREDGKFATLSGSNPTYKITGWVNTKGEATTITTDDTNDIEFKGLGDGKYTLTETDAPDGYLVAAPADVNIVAANMDVEVDNKTGSVLPETGGIGTTVFYAVGGLLVLGAVVILLMKKRSVTE